MNMLKPLTIVALVAATFLAACSQQPAFTEQKLPSGRVVKIAGIGKMQFSAGDPALMLKYYSEVSFDRPAELKAEVEEIWQEFRKDADKGGFKAAIISANEMPHGVISSTRGWNFVYEKHADGTWALNEKK